MTEQTTDNNDGGDSGAQDWRAGLPDDLRESPALKDYKDINGLAKSHVELQKKIGQKPGMADLDAPTDAEERSKVYARLGKPDSPDGYKFDDAADARDFRLFAHKNNLTSEQAEGVYKDLTEANKAAKAKSEESFKDQLAEAEKKTREAYESKWGDKYEEERTLTDQAMEKFLPEDGREMFKTLGLNNEPYIIDLFNKLGHAMSEDQLFGGSGTPNSGADDYEATRTERYKLMKDPEFQGVLNNPMHPQYNDYRAKYRQLFDRENELAIKKGIVT